MSGYFMIAKRNDVGQWTFLSVTGRIKSFLFLFRKAKCGQGFIKGIVKGKINFKICEPLGINNLSYISNLSYKLLSKILFSNNIVLRGWGYNELN